MQRKRRRSAMVTTGIVLAAVVAACSPSVPSPLRVGTTSPPSTASATPQSTTLTVQVVTAHILRAHPQELTLLASGHWLYPDDMNDTIVYDGTVVVHGHPVTVALSHNGLHYAYTLARGLGVYVDGRRVATGTFIPDVFAVSDDGATVLYSDSKAVGIDGVIYRNGVAVYHSPYDVGLAVGSADAMHYTAVVSTVSGELVHDGRTVATSGINGELAAADQPRRRPLRCGVARSGRQ